MIVMVQVSISLRLGSPAMANVEQGAIVFVLQQRMQTMVNWRRLTVQEKGHQFVSCQVSFYMKIKTNYKLYLASLYCMYVLYRDSLLSTISISAFLKTLTKLVKTPVNSKRKLCQNSYPGQQF